MKSFNHFLNKNTILRGEIDELFNERHIFDKIYTRIGQEATLYSNETVRVVNDMEHKHKLIQSVRLDHIVHAHVFVSNNYLQKVPNCTFAVVYLDCTILSLYICTGA